MFERTIYIIIITNIIAVIIIKLELLTIIILSYIVTKTKYFSLMLLILKIRN